MKLQEALSQIQDGDILSVYPTKKSKLIDKLISDWEGPNTPFHTALLVWQIKDGVPILMTLQMDPGKHNILPISHYAVNKLHVIKKPKDLKIDGAKLLATVDQLSYDLYGAIISGLHQYFTHLPFIRTRRKKFCSQYVADVYNLAGYMPYIPDVSDPFVLETLLVKNGLRVIEIEPCA